jgi:hypothetical protein
LQPALILVKTAGTIAMQIWEMAVRYKMEHHVIQAGFLELFKDALA